MTLNSPIPSRKELLHEFAEKKLDYLLALNRLKTRISESQDTACDLIAISGDEEWCVQVKWFEAVPSARQYCKGLIKADTQRRSTAVLAIVIDRGEQLFVDNSLKNILTIIPTDTKILSIDSLVNTLSPGA